MWRKKMVVGAALLILSTPGFAETRTRGDLTHLSDAEAYCEYVTQQAAAQSALLRMPSAVAGVTQPNTGLPSQLLWGLSSSLSDIRKAGLTADAAQKNCDLYAATTAAQQSIQYALPTLEKKALQHRLDLLEQACGKLDELIAASTAMVNAQDLTRPMLFSLQTTKIKLNADQADTQAKIAALYTPDLAERPLQQLVEDKQAREVSAQNALNKLARQNNWDVALSVGAHQQIRPWNDSSGPYGAITVSYSLGSREIGRHLDQAADAYAVWNAVQEGDVVRNAAILKKQVAASASVQADRLKTLLDQQKQLEGALQLVAAADTTAAIDFRNQLTSAQLLLGIDIGDASFRLDELRDFLDENY